MLWGRRPFIPQLPLPSLMSPVWPVLPVSEHTRGERLTGRACAAMLVWEPLPDAVTRRDL